MLKEYTKIFSDLLEPKNPLKNNQEPVNWIRKTVIKNGEMDS